MFRMNKVLKPLNEEPLPLILIAFQVNHSRPKTKLLGPVFGTSSLFSLEVLWPIGIDLKNNVRKRSFEIKIKSEQLLFIIIIYNM